MAGITLAQAETNLAAWVAASAAAANNQSYSIGDRAMTRVNAPSIQKQIEFWQSWVQRLSRTKNRTRYVVPK